MMMVLIFTIDQWPGSGQEAAGCKKSMMKTSLLTAGLVIMLNPETPGRFIGWEQKVNYFQVGEGGCFYKVCSTNGWILHLFPLQLLSKNDFRMTKENSDLSCFNI